MGTGEGIATGALLEEEPSALAIGPPVRPRYKLCPALLCALRKALS